MSELFWFTNTLTRQTPTRNILSFATLNDALTNILTLTVWNDSLLAFFKLWAGTSLGPCEGQLIHSAAFYRSLTFQCRPAILKTLQWTSLIQVESRNISRRIPACNWALSLSAISKNTSSVLFHLICFTSTPIF